jgi:hypothetical protein
MLDTNSTEKQLNRLSEFRQAVYQHSFGARRDALLELLDVLLLKAPVASFPMLSLSGWCRRKWPSLYAAVEDGHIDRTWLWPFLARQVPATGLQVFALDGTSWARPQARTLADRQYVYHPSQAINGGTVVVGYGYSLLDWPPFRQRSWALSVDVARIPSAKTAVEQGVEQVEQLCQARRDCLAALDIVAADQKYGNHKFFGPLKGQRCGVVVVLRPDRVLYRRPTAAEQPAKGRKRKHGRRFAFKEPGSWGEPVEFIRLEDDRWGQVEIRRWNDVHEKPAADTPIDVIQARVHLEREKPPKSFWIGWQAPPRIPAQVEVNAHVLWTAYQHRWPIEPGIRFRKQTLMWTTPQFHTPEACDRWSVLVGLATWLLYLARPVVADQRLPWQAPQPGELTPGRVQRGMPDILCKVGTPVRVPKTRGKAPGWPLGKSRHRRQRCSAVKKGPPKPKNGPKSA